MVGSSLIYMISFLGVIYESKVAIKYKLDCKQSNVNLRPLLISDHLSWATILGGCLGENGLQFQSSKFITLKFVSHGEEWRVSVSPESPEAKWNLKL